MSTDTIKLSERLSISQGVTEDGCASVAIWYTAGVGTGFVSGMVHLFPERVKWTEALVTMLRDLAPERLAEGEFTDHGCEKLSICDRAGHVFPSGDLTK